MAKTKACWSGASRGLLLTALEECASDGGQSDNGWKAWVWTKASTRLEGSEDTDGGAPKDTAACTSQWGSVCVKYCV